MSILDTLNGVPDVPSIVQTMNGYGDRFKRIERHMNRRNLGFYRYHFPKKIPDLVNQDLERAINVLLDKEPRIKEVWLFGSYARGTFDRRESDIDLAAFVDCEEYFYTEITPWDYYEDGIIVFKYKEHSPAIKELRASIDGKVTFSEIYSVHIIANGDHPYTQDRGFETDEFLREIRKGKLLYPRKN